MSDVTKIPHEEPPLSPLMADQRLPGDVWNPLIAEHIGPYYVYLLLDPESHEVFYVGKGTGTRFLQHGVEALMTPEATTPEEAGEKIGRIHQIRKSGGEPEVEFARIRIPTESEAFVVESTLIDALSRHAAALTNAVRGHDSERGLVTLSELKQKVAAPELTTDEKAILIKLGWWTPDDDTELPRKGFGFKPGMAPAALYDSTRAWWVLSPARAKSYPYAVAVFQGVTRGVWQIDQMSWRYLDSPTRGRAKRRWAFEAQPADTKVTDAFFAQFGRRIPATRPGGGAVFGSGSPIAYWPA